MIRYIAQKHESGCLIACIAMVLGWNYDDVDREFLNDFNKRGINPDYAKEFICDYGFSVIEKRGGGYIDLKAHNKRMLEPFAPAHIVSVCQFIDAKCNHAVVIDGRGRVFDPHDRARKDIPCYRVEHVMGFFKT